MTVPAVVFVTAIFDRLDGTPATERTVELSHSNGYLRMRGGPTGYESAGISQPIDKDWAACFGTPGRWDQCIVPADEVNRALRELGVAP